MMTDREKREQEISDLCDQHDCKEKIRKIHFQQYVHSQWHPHPSAEFRTWWETQYERSQGLDAVRAFNSKPYHQRFLENKEAGLA